MVRKQERAKARAESDKATQQTDLGKDVKTASGDDADADDDDDDDADADDDDDDDGGYEYEDCLEWAELRAQRRAASLYPRYVWIPPKGCCPDSCPCWRIDLRMHVAPFTCAGNRANAEALAHFATNAATDASSNNHQYVHVAEFSLPLKPALVKRVTRSAGSSNAKPSL